MFVRTQNATAYFFDDQFQKLLKLIDKFFLETLVYELHKNNHNHNVVLIKVDNYCVISIQFMHLLHRKRN